MPRGQCLRLLGVRLTTCCICYSASASTSKSIGYEVEADALGENHIFDRNAEQELPSNADTTKLPAAPFIDKYNEDSATDESVGDAPQGRDVTPSAFLLREQEKETQTKGQEEAESIEKRDDGTSERRGLRGVGVKLNDANAEPSTAKLNGADSADETTLLQTQSSLKKETRVDRDFDSTAPDRLTMQYTQDEKRNNETANVINRQFEDRNKAVRLAAKMNAALKEQHQKQEIVDYHRHKVERAAANHDAAVQNAAAAVDNAE